MGSTSYITNLDGDVVQHIEYVPFGEVFFEERNNRWNTPYLFNAKELDEETGLYYYGARYYDPRVSLWLSVDPLAIYNPFEVENFIDGKHNNGVYNSFNHAVYGYCYQSPVRFIDPNGKQTESYAKGYRYVFKSEGYFKRKERQSTPLAYSTLVIEWKNNGRKATTFYQFNDPETDTKAIEYNIKAKNNDLESFNKIKFIYKINDSDISKMMKESDVKKDHM